MVKTQTKTKTIVAVALTILSIGLMLAGLYYYYGCRSHRLINKLPVNGVCGSSDGQAFAFAPIANLCGAGTPTSVTGSGPWYWNCTGTNGGTNASCSASIQNGPIITLSHSSYNFGSVDIGDSETTTITASNTGNADLTLDTISINGTGFSRQGGTCVVNGQTLAPQANCTVTARFAPSSAGSFSGSLSISSSVQNVNASLSGTGSSMSGGNTDLTIINFDSVKSPNNHDPFPVSVMVVNQGSSSTGAFTVKGYFSVDEIPNNGGLPADYLLFTWNVPGLGAGASLSNTFSVSFSGFPIHHYYYVVVKVDADDAIAESNEGNNIVTKAVYVSR